jgi:hypothetical protein
MLFDGMSMLDYLVIVLAFAVVCGATLLYEGEEVSSAGSAANSAPLVNPQVNDVGVDAFRRPRGCGSLPPAATGRAEVPP